MQRSIAPAIIFFLLIVLSESLALAQESTLRDRFASEAPDGWRALEAYSKKVEGSGVETISYRGVDAPTLRGGMYFLFNGPLGLSKIRAREGRDDKDAQIVSGVNSRYAFHLEQKSASSPFVVTYFGQEREKVGHAGFTTLRIYIEAPWMIAAKPLHAAVAEPGFVLKQITPVSIGEKSCARIEFDYEPTDPKSTAVRGGWITLDPDSHWAIQEYELTTPWGWVLGSVEYGDTIKGVPTLRRVTQVQRGKDSRETENRFDFDEFVPRAAPEREFTLSAFGLPELDLPGKRDYGSHTGYWLVGLGVLSGIAAFVVWWRPRRS